MELPINYNEASLQERRRAREIYKIQQKGLCYYCGELLDLCPPREVRKLYVDRSLFPYGFFKYPEHLHHDHDTGMTIGTVHAYCNAILWMYHDE